SPRFVLGGIDRARQRPFLLLAIERRIGLPDILARGLLPLDADDVGPALVAGEEILAAVSVEEFSERLDAANDEQEIILTFEREHGVNEVVACSLLAQLDL